MRRAIAGDLAPRAHTTLLAKDARLALEMAAAHGFRASLGAVAGAAFARGYADLDDASLLEACRHAARAGRAASPDR